jgi:DNA-binding transcriptional regulator YiaG
MVTMKASPLFTATEIETLRKALGFSQEKLAAECGVNRTAVCHWESGIRAPSGPSAKHLINLRDSLGKRGRKKSG